MPPVRSAPTGHDRLAQTRSGPSRVTAGLRSYVASCPRSAPLPLDRPGPSPPRQESPPTARPDRFALLVCGGADGSGGIARRARAVAASGLDIELAVICGRNDRARMQLRGLRDAHGRTIVVRGFVDNMAEWVRASDVVASKAGPGTIAEALCCCVPLLLTSYLPGQERGNVEWVSDVGAGRYVPRVGQLIDAVAELAVPDSPRFASMRAAVRQVARPDATARIAQLIAGFTESTSNSR